MSLCKEFFYFLQGWEFAHRFSEQIARFLKKMSDWLKKTSDSLICSFLVSIEQPERIAHGCSFLVSDLSESLMVAHFWWVTWAIRSHRSFLVSDLSDLLTSLIKKGVMSESLIFFKRTKNVLKIQLLSNFFEQIAHSLIYHERPERIAHSRSFDLSDLSKLANERWANERIPSPDFLL